MSAQIVKEIALSLGFDLVGVANARDSTLKDAVSRYAQWIDAGHSASMDYLRRHAEQKASPEKFFPGLKSIVCLGIVYGDGAKPNSKQDNAGLAQVAQYTRGPDYHGLLEEKLSALSGRLIEALGGEFRAFVDYSAVLERFWAWRAGLGWVGKNAMLINRRIGSYFFLGGLFCTLELEPDSPDTDHCGRCRKCIDACPTHAIADGRFIESAKCVAYHTIENRGAIPPEVMAGSGRWVAGCDICQEVCPWNDPVTPSRSITTTNPAYDLPLVELARWTEFEFKEKMRDIAMGRMKYAGFLRNVAVAVANSDLTRSEKGMAFEQLEKHIQELPHGEPRSSAEFALGWAKKI